MAHNDEEGHVGHNHAAGVTNEFKLGWAIGLTGTFLIAEIIGGVLTDSLALLSDAAHMFTDVMALVIALIAIKIGAGQIIAVLMAIAGLRFLPRLLMPLSYSL